MTETGTMDVGLGCRIERTCRCGFTAEDGIAKENKGDYDGNESWVVCRVGD